MLEDFFLEPIWNFCCDKIWTSSLFSAIILNIYVERFHRQFLFYFDTMIARTPRTIFFFNNYRIKKGCLIVYQRVNRKKVSVDIFNLKTIHQLRTSVWISSLKNLGHDYEECILKLNYHSFYSLFFFSYM